MERAEAAAKADRLGEAEGICQDLVDADPTNAPALAQWAGVANRRGRRLEAIALYARALALVPENERWLGTYAELCRLTARPAEGLVAARRALGLGERTAQKHLRIGRILFDLGQFEEATYQLMAATAIDPENAVAHFLLAECLLMRGEFRAGWIEYEWRKKLDVPPTLPPNLRAPVWNGMRMPRTRILLAGEQGFGDMLQFARYIPLVAERCSEVVLVCPAPLRSLFARIPGLGVCVNEWQHVPGFGAHALLSSLPFIFNTDADSIPQAPYLTADPGKATDWAGRLTAAAPEGRLRVGLCWAGRPQHGNDRRRSMGLAQLAPLAAVDGVRYVSLQKEPRVGDAGSFSLFPEMLDLSRDFLDFDETAALMSHLDLVITVDSAIAHLGGALGKAVWMLTARPSDWRWLSDRDDSPWYPSLRLFRQPEQGAWGLVIETVRRELSVVAAQWRTAGRVSRASVPG